MQFLLCRGHSVTRGAAGVGETLARYRYELPVVAGDAQGQLQNTGGIPVGHLHIGRWAAQRVVALASGAHHELPDAARLVMGPARRLWRPPLVVVVMPGEDD